MLDIVAPIRCAGCRAWGAELCPACEASLMATPQPSPVGGIKAAFAYRGPIVSVVRAAKYHDARSALRQISQTAASRLVVPRGSSLVPVPLGRKRRRHRGYNQAELLANVLAEPHRNQVCVDLIRVRDTRTQVGRSRSDRDRNVAGAFEWRGRDLTGCKVVLVDDVSTTGATLRAAATALHAAGAASVSAVVLARKL